jgi:hypothetical protein
MSGSSKSAPRCRLPTILPTRRAPTSPALAHVYGAGHRHCPLRRRSLLRVPRVTVVRGRARRIWTLAAALAVVVATPGIPLDTEDTGTAARVEVELGATYETASDGHAGDVDVAIGVNVG